HAVTMTNGVVVDHDTIDRLFTEETAALRAYLGEPSWADGRFEQAATLLRTWTAQPELLPFFPIEAADLV
ncbi:MAG: hypothetical protein ACPHFO_07725, partial [Acidimicrobiales bacterium]